MSSDLQPAFPIIRLMPDEAAAFSNDVRYMAQAYYWKQVNESRHRIVLRISKQEYALNAEAIPNARALLWAEEGNSAYIALELEEGNGYALISTWKNGFNGTVSAETFKEARRLRATITGAVTKIAPPTDALRMGFWSQGPSGSSVRHRMLTGAPFWADVRDNYTASTRAELERLNTMTAIGDGLGRLILMSGPPGTGKSYAIMALARTIADWCDVSCIIDPEAFFHNAAYMNTVLLGKEEHTVDSDDDDDDDPGATKPKPWTMLVIEDADELISIDAKERSGQALSRLLNLTAGMLGHGLNIYVCITTNVELARLSPAVTRAGRCRANIKFDLLDGEEAAAWCARHNRPGVGGPALLADLYHGDGLVNPPQAKTVGFR